MARRHATAHGIVCATAGALLWGFSGSCSQFLFSEYQLDPVFVTAMRSLVAGPLFALALLLRYRGTLREVASDKAAWGRYVVFSVALFASQITYLMSVRDTNAGTATVLQMSGTVFIMAFTCFSTRSLPRVREALGLLAALAGTWLIATQGDLSNAAIPLSGLMWGLVNGLAVAVYIIVPRRLFVRYGSFFSTGVAMFLVGLIAVAWWAAQGAPGLAAVPELDAAAWVVLVGGVGAVGTFAAFGLYLHGVSVVGSVAGGLLGAFEPLGAMVVSAVWLGTAFTGADWAGFALMVGMLVLVTAGGKPDTANSRR